MPILRPNAILKRNRIAPVKVFEWLSHHTENPWLTVVYQETTGKLITMKTKIALTALALAAQATFIFAGEMEVSSKNVIQPAPPPPTSYFRGNEWDVSLFGTYDTSFNHNRGAIGDHAWGGGVGLAYFPWIYAGFGADWELVNTIPGDNLAHQVNGKFYLRYPLDLISPNFHLAPYA